MINSKWNVLIKIIIRDTIGIVLIISRFVDRNMVGEASKNDLLSLLILGIFFVYLARQIIMVTIEILNDDYVEAKGDVNKNYFWKLRGNIELNETTSKRTILKHIGFIYGVRGKNKKVIYGKNSKVVYSIE